jgi:hypothetical protein
MIGHLFELLRELDSLVECSFFLFFCLNLFSSSFDGFLKLSIPSFVHIQLHVLFCLDKSCDQLATSLATHNLKYYINK